MDLGIAGRVAAVAASSRGIGRACALALGAEGCHVAICARGEEALRATEQEIGAAGVRTVATVADVSRDEDRRRFLSAAEELGGIDILVTNAGGPPSGTVDAFDAADYRAAVEMNLVSAVEMTRSVLPGMRRRRWGRVINIASVAVKQPLDGLILSNTARTALVGFSKTLASEVAGEGVTVNTVCPGPTLTDRMHALATQRAERESISAEEALRAFTADIPAARLGRPGEIAALVAFLAGEPAAYLTGATIQVDGGLSRGLL